MKRQRGVVLLLALVLSLLLGVLTASALREAVVETRMAGDMRDGLLAFEEAEATLQAGASELERAPLIHAQRAFLQPGRMICRGSGSTRNPVTFIYST